MTHFCGFSEPQKLVFWISDIPRFLHCSYISLAEVLSTVIVTIYSSHCFSGSRADLNARSHCGHESSKSSRNGIFIPAFIDYARLDIFTFHDLYLRVLYK